MLARPAVRCQAPQTWLAAAVLALPACSMQIKEPAANAVVNVPLPTSPTKVVVTGNTSFTALKVMVDGIDFSSRMASTASNREEGDLSLAAGTHTLVARADMNCWYCAGGKSPWTDTKTFCVAVAGAPAGVTTKTTFAKIDDLSWASDGCGTALSNAQDSGASTTRWRFRPAGGGGVGTDVGRIESIQFPDRCVRSPDNTKGSAIVLATCNTADTRQQWISSWQQQPPPGNKRFYRFENQQVSLDGATWGCLTKGSASDPRVTQSDCNNALDGLWWAVRNNATNMLESEVNPWGQ